jgi:hypothetical protein
MILRKLPILLRLLKKKYGTGITMKLGRKETD